MAYANSYVFSSSVVGNSSGQTALDMIANVAKAQSDYISQFSNSKIGIDLPKVPSNQGIAKDK